MGAYTTLDAVRSMDRVNDTDAFDDDAVADAIDYAKGKIDRKTHTTFGDVDTPAFDPFEVEAYGNGTEFLMLVDDDGFPVRLPRTVIDVTRIDRDGNEITIAGARVDKAKSVLRLGTRSWTGDTYRITGTAGYADTPDDLIRWAAGKIAQDHLLRARSGLPDRLLAQATQYGPVRVAQAGREYAVGIPDVDQVLNDYVQYTVAFG